MNLVRKLLQSLGFKLIQSQLLLLISLLLLSGVVTIGIIYYGMEADASTINMAGRQRMLSQKVAKEALLFQYDLGSAENVKKTASEFESAMQSLLNGNKAKNISVPATAEIKNQLNKVKHLWVNYHKDILLFIEHDHTFDNTAVVSRINKNSPIVLKQMNIAVQMIASQSNASVKHNMYISLSLIIVLLLLSAGFYLYVNRFLMRPLLPLGDALQELSKGDLTHHLPVDETQDEISVLYDDYNNVINDFSAILGHVVTSSEQLNVSSEQLNHAAMTNADAMDQQYQEIELISTAMNEISVTIQEVATSSATAAEYTEDAELQADKGRDTVKNATAIIDELSQQVQTVSNSISLLNQNSLQISKVLDVINDIAEQTNLLALNAAIEAARAGEYGRGFAVVADEVRGLAARTANSTNEIQQMVEQLQNQSKESVTSIKSSQEKADLGVEHMKLADIALEEIVKSVASINEMNSHIANATKEESKVANDMNEKIVHVADTSSQTRTNSANDRELAEHLSQLGNTLRENTIRFTL